MGPSADDALYVANFDGSDEHVLPTSGLGRGLPTWSPDGRWIAYSPRHVTPYGFEYTPYLVSADGSRAPIKLAEQGETGPWSPDSTMLVLRGATNATDPFRQTHSVYRLSDDKTRTYATGVAYSEQWSPSGRQLAFVSADREGGAALFIDDVASGSVTKIPGLDGIVPALPLWSPDGSQIAFLGIPGGYGYGPCE